MAQQPTIVSGQNIIVPAPQAGDNVTITSSPSGNLTFEFDINSAEPSRVDNDLVLQTPEGSVTIGNFFAVGEESLPTLTLTDGIVVDASDFFDGSGVDMTTAAGPAGARADGSGTSYDDGAGALIDGIDRLGSLGNFHWGRDVEFGGEDLGLLGPVGDFAFSINTEWGGTSISGVYEDGRPNQHTGDYVTQLAGKIDLTFSVGAGTTVGNIIFSGFSDSGLDPSEQGTFYLGDPSGPAGSWTELTQADSYSFTQGQLTSPGVYYMPGDNDRDNDIDFTISVTFTGPNGASVTQSQTGTIIVDAVADKPDVQNGDIDFNDGAHEGGVEGLDKTESEFNTGWLEVENKQDTSATVDIKIPFSATLTFHDYKDGSELHYALVERPTDPAGVEWSCEEASGLVTLYYDGDRVVWDSSRGPIAEHLGDLDYTGDVADLTTKDYFQIPVNNSDIVDDKYTVKGDLTAKSPEGQGQNIFKDENIKLEVVGKAVEDYRDQELDLNNNHAYAKGENTLTLDVINSTLTIKAGWASEGGNDHKHNGDASYNPQDGVFVATDDGSALINISLAGQQDGSAESIVSVELTLDTDMGTLYINGNPIVSYDPADGGVKTITVPVDSLGSLTFKPHKGDLSYDDVEIKYNIVVQNEAGVENTYTGDFKVVVDAVADQPIVVTDPQIEFPSDYTAAKPGDKITVHGKVNFPDDSGGEKHFFTFKLHDGSLVEKIEFTETLADGITTYTYTVSPGEPDGFTYKCYDSAGSLMGEGDLFLKGNRWSVPLHDDSEMVDADIYLKFAEDISKKGAITIGGRAEVDSSDMVVKPSGDYDADKDYEYDTANNEANESGTIYIPVDGKVTCPDVEIGRAYENAAGEEHLGKYRPTEGYWAVAKLEEGHELNIKPNQPAEDRGQLEDLKKYSAVIDIKHMPKGSEFVSGFAISFDAHDKNDPAATGQFMLGSTLIPIDTEGVIDVLWKGKSLKVSCSFDADGKVTLIIMADGDGALLSGEMGLPFYYVPGTDHSHEDIDFDIAMSVTNHSNDYTQIFDNDGDDSNDSKLSGLAEILKDAVVDNGIIPENSENNDFIVGTEIDGAIGGGDHKAEIDAVAQKPEFDVGDPKGIEILDESNQGTGEHYKKIVPGSNATITLKDVDLHGDFDGSQGHALLVQLVDGYDINHLEITLEDGTTVSLEGYGEWELQSYKGDFYGEFSLEALLDKYNAEPANSEKLSMDDIKGIGVNVTTPTGKDSGSIKLVVRAHEDWDKVTQNSEGGKDSGEREYNNTAHTEGTAEIYFSSASQPSLNVVGHVFENRIENAHIDDTKVNMPARIQVGTGDFDDVLLSFNLALDSPSDGSFWLFPTADAYTSFVDAVVKQGVDVLTALNQFGVEKGGAITLDDLKAVTDAGSINASGQITGGFGGEIVYLPGAETYSDKDPSFTWNIQVHDPQSGQTLGNTADNPYSDTIVTDAVAQKPDASGTSAEDVHTSLGDTTPIEKEITVTFTDGDGSTAHYFLVEALPGWTISVKGESPLNPETLEKFTADGKVYYKIPAADLDFGGGNTATGSIVIEILPPDNPMYWHMLGGSSSSNNQRPYEISVGGMSHDKGVGDGEFTFHNNTAVDESGGISGTLDRPIYGHGIEQKSPVYEDNQPNQHEGKSDEELGEFVVSFPAGSTDVVITVDVKGDEPQFIIDGPGVTNNGDGTYTIDPNAFTNKGSVHVGVNPDYPGAPNSDVDGGLKLSYTENGTTVTHECDVIVDAVADKPSVSIDAINSEEHGNNAHLSGGQGGDIHNDAIISGEADDSVARFVINAEFGDTDGSETHYLLVESTPGWSLDGELRSYNPSAPGGYDSISFDPKDCTTIYYEGKQYWQIKLEANDYSPEGKYGLGMQFTGTVKDIDDFADKGNTHKGVTDFEFKVGAMSKESNLSDGEGDLKNNISVNVDDLVIELSPVDSEISLTYTGGAKLEEGDTIFFKLSGFVKDASDVLTELSVDNPGGGTLYYGSEAAGWTPFDGAITDLNALDQLSTGTGGYGFKFVPDSKSHEDVTFSYSATVKDSVSGASKDFNGPPLKVIVDAVADSSNHDDPLASYDGDYDAAKLGEPAVVTVETKFGDLENNSETHYVVFEQKDGYKVFGIEFTPVDEDGVPLGPTIQLAPNQGDWDKYVSTQFDDKGNPYYALKVPQGQDYKVDFHVTTPINVTEDYSEKLGAGTIVVETTKNDSSGNREPNYTNNWQEDIHPVEIKTGVVTTIKVEGQNETIDEQEHIGLTLSLVDKDSGVTGSNESITTLVFNELKGGSLWYDGQEYPAVNGKITLNFGVGEFDTSLLEYRPNGHWSGRENIKYTATVTDNASGDSKEFADNSLNVTVRPVADAPTIEDATFTNDGDGALQLALTASLVDDSETLYVVVQKVPGLIAGYEVVTHPDTRVQYYRVPAVTGEETQMSFTTNGEFETLPEVYAMSEESNGKFALTQADHKGWGYNIVDAPDPASLGDYDFESSSTPVYFTGSAANERVTGSSHDDIINLGNGNDVVFGSAGSDTLIGGAGSDTLDYSPITGGTGIFANLADGQITLGDPNAGGWQDTVSGFEEFIGTDFGDEIHLGGGITTVRGGAGDDRIFGSEADETIYAGGGNNLIYGGKGNDTMHAGDGQDTFAWKASDLGSGGSMFTDSIVGFSVGDDTLRFDMDIFNLDSIESLIQGATEKLGMGSVTLDDTVTGNTLALECSLENQTCTVSVGKTGEETTQTIELTNVDFGTFTSDSDWAALLENMIKIDTGG